MQYLLRRTTRIFHWHLRSHFHLQMFGHIFAAPTLLVHHFRKTSPKFCFRGHNFHTRTQNACFPRRSSPRYTYSSEIFSFIPQHVSFPEGEATPCFSSPASQRESKIGERWGKRKNIVRAAVTEMRIASLKIRIHVSFFGPKARGERAKKINRRFSPISQRMLSLKERITRQAGP